MLVYSDKRYIPTDLNVMVIEDSVGKYYYIHRLLYNSAVILNYKYKGQITELAQLIAGPQGNSERFDVQIFYDKVPNPINILAPYLLLCNEAFDDLQDMVGALHVMSNTIDFVKYIAVPYEARVTQLDFSLSIREEYKLGWDNFKQTCIEYREDLFIQKTMSMLGTANGDTMSVPIANTVAKPEPEPVVTNEQPTQVQTVTAPEGYFWVEGLPDGVFIPDGTQFVNDMYKWTVDGKQHVLRNGEYSVQEAFDPFALLDQLKANKAKAADGGTVTMTETNAQESTSVHEPEESEQTDDAITLSKKAGLEGLAALGNII